MWVSSYGNEMADPQAIDRFVRCAKMANLNALVVQIRKLGDAHYESHYEPRAENIKDPDFDPLAYLIEKAHAEGIEVHAWMNTYKIWAGTKRPVSPEHVFNKHPEWVNKNNKGQSEKGGNYALDPGIREVQEHTYNVYMDVVKNYDIDGIHFDYVRYWDPDFGYSKLAVDRFNKDAGRSGIPKSDDPLWLQWRRDRVTDLVRQVYEGVQATKPWVKVTAAVICSGDCTQNFKDTRPHKLLLQEWDRWLREGIIDTVIPMNYKKESDPQAAKQFRDWAKGMVRWKYGRQAYNGIGITDAKDYVTQVTASRKAGTDGVCGFAYNSIKDKEAFASSLRAHLYPTWVPTPPMPWKAERTSGGPKPPAGPQQLFDQAIYYASKGNDLDKAIELLKEAILQDINFTEAHFRLGRCCIRKGMKAEAEAQFKETLELNPNHGGALVEMQRLADSQ